MSNDAKHDATHAPDDQPGVQRPGTRFQRFLTRKFFNSLISKEELQDLFTPIRRTYKGRVISLGSFFHVGWLSFLATISERPVVLNHRREGDFLLAALTSWNSLARLEPRCLHVG